MKITKVTVYPVDLPYQGGVEWHYVFGRSKSVFNLFVKIDTDEGISGWGIGSAPHHYGESKQGAVTLVEEHFKPFLIGKDPANIESIGAGLDGIIRWNNHAKAAIDLALWDILGKSLGVPVYKLIGGKVRDRVPLMPIVPLLEPPEAGSRCLKLVEEGYRHLKIKIAGELEKDVARVKEIRKAVGDNVELLVDANQTYDVAGAIALGRRLQEYNVSTIEQPVALDNFAGLAEVTRNVTCFVEGDESARSPADIFQLTMNRCVSSISLKVQKLGGISNTKKAAYVCAAGFMPCRMGTAMGSRLLAAADMQVIASTTNLGAPAQIGQFAGLDNDPAQGIEVSHGFLTVPEGPGLGITVNL